MTSRESERTSERSSSDGSDSGVTRRAYLGGLAAALGTPAFAIEARADTTKVDNGNTSATQTVTSPDGTVSFTLDASGGSLTYSLSYDGETLVGSSELGRFSFAGQADFGSGLTVTGATTSSTDTTWTPVWDRYEQIDEHYRQLRVGVEETSSPNRSLTVEVRAFDDGVGFRYVFPQGAGFGTAENSVEITAETTRFAFGGDYTSWWIPNTFDSYEIQYEETTLSNVGGAEFRGETFAGANTPITMRTGTGTYLAVHEAALTDYASMSLEPVSEGSTAFESALCPLPGGSKVKTSGPREMPWRTIQAGDSAGDLVESSLVLNLNEPLDTSSGPFSSSGVGTDWIEPSKFMGVWWLMITGRADWEYQGPQTGNHGATTARAKRYMDFASEHGIESVLVEGWNEGWSSYPGDGSAFDFDESYPDFDLQGVTDYGATLSPPVEMTMHNETAGDISNYESQIDPSSGAGIYSDYDDLGIRSIKTGYVSDSGVRIDGTTYRHHSQPMVNHYEFTAEQAAAERQMLEIHEPIKATGKRRTYPNLMTREGVYGQEYDSFFDATPEHHVTFPFTRMLAGPVEYTPGIFDLESGSNGMRTSLVKQLAMYPTYFSGLQMVADLPSSYLADRPATLSVGDVAQAEFGEVSGLPVAAKWGNAQGGRYVAFDFNRADAGDTLSWTVEDIPSAGEYDLHLRVANFTGDTPTADAVTVRVNGTAVARPDVPQTSYWDEWATTTVPVTLGNGDNDLTLELGADDGGAFNLDAVAVTETGASTPTPAEDPTLGPTKPAFEFVEQVPAAWDDTVVVDAEIGDYSAMARRNGEEWYVGVMTDEQPRAVDVPLSFLGTGPGSSTGQWVAEIYADAPDAAFPDARDGVATYDVLVSPSDTLVASTIGSGGQAVRLRPATTEETSTVESYATPDQTYDGVSAPATAAEGQAFDVTVSGTNAGNVVGGETVTVFVDGAAEATTTARLAPGTDDATVPVTVDTAGTYEVTVGPSLPEAPDPVEVEVLPPVPGYETFTTDTATFESTGRRIRIGTGGVDQFTGNRDDYSTVYRPGNASQVTEARVTIESFDGEGTDGSARAGFVLRNDLTANGSSGGYVAMFWRESDGAVKLEADLDGDGKIDSFSTSDPSVTLPVEYSLLKEGSTVRARYRTPGADSWTELGGGYSSVSVSGGQLPYDLPGVSDPQDVGIYGNAHATGASLDVTFRDFRVVGDADADGLYEDVDGDGESTYDDVVTLFENAESEFVEATPGRFDFNGNGRFDYVDVVRLFQGL